MSIRAGVMAAMEAFEHETGEKLVELMIPPRLYRELCAEVSDRYALGRHGMVFLPHSVSINGCVVSSE